MEKAFLVLGIFVGVYGLLLLIAPRLVLKIDGVVNRVIPLDAKILSRKYLVAAILILAGVYMIYVWATY